jgi:hypothetical protein
VHFDGATWLSIVSLTATSPRQFFSVIWLRVASLNDNPFSPLGVTDPNTLYDPLLELETGNSPSNFFSYSSVAGGGALKGFTLNETVSAGVWLPLLVSADSNHAQGAKVVQMYLGDSNVLDVAQTVDSGPAFDMVFNGLSYFFGSDAAGDTLTADVADVRIDPGRFVDFSVEANRRLFIGANGKPVDPAVATASLGIPVILFSGDATGFAVNQGTGGAFTLTGALTNASTSPSD